MGELLEDGVLLVGVSGTLVSMRIAPALLGEFQGTRGLLEWLRGSLALSSLTLGTCSAATASGSGFDLRLMRDMTNPLCPAVQPWSFLPSMLTL